MLSLSVLVTGGAAIFVLHGMLASNNIRRRSPPLGCWWWWWGGFIFLPRFSWLRKISAETPVSLECSRGSSETWRARRAARLLFLLSPAAAAAVPASAKALCPNKLTRHAMALLRLWRVTSGNRLARTTDYTYVYLALAAALVHYVMSSHLCNGV